MLQVQKHYNTTQLREEFLIDDLIQSGEIKFTYSHYERYIAGPAVPASELKLVNVLYEKIIFYNDFFFEL